MSKAQWQKRILGALLLVAIPLSIRAGLEGWKFSQASELRRQGAAFDHAKRRSEAIAAYTRCLELYPYFSDVYQELAEIYLEEKQTDKALECLDLALKYSPQDPLSQAVVYRQRGYFYFRTGQQQKAITDLERSLQLDPKEALSQQLLQRAKALAKPTPAS